MELTLAFAALSGHKQAALCTTPRDFAPRSFVHLNQQKVGERRDLTALAAPKELKLLLLGLHALRSFRDGSAEQGLSRQRGAALNVAFSIWVKSVCLGSFRKLRGDSALGTVEREKGALPTMAGSPPMDDAGREVPK